MATAIDRFLKRYGISKSAPDLLLLRQVGHAFSFLPYENVTKILKETGNLTGQAKFRSAEEVLEDHLRWNTGGTCFSLCNTLDVLLKHCGFHSFIAMGDMHYGANIHCAVVVSLEEGSYLMDPGYLLCQPIQLPQSDLQIICHTPMNVILLERESDGIFSLYTREGGQQKWRYRLRAWPISQEEFYRHWLHSFSLNSMENILMSRLDSCGRFYFRKNRLEMVQQDRRIKRIIDAGESAELSKIFGVPADLIRQAEHALTGRRPA